MKDRKEGGGWEKDLENLITKGNNRKRKEEKERKNGEKISKGK